MIDTLAVLAIFWGVAILFILAILLQVEALYDVALVLALLAVVGTVALTQSEKSHD